MALPLDDTPVVGEPLESPSTLYRIDSDGRAQAVLGSADSSLAADFQNLGRIR